MSVQITNLAWRVELPTTEMRIVMLKLCDVGAPNGIGKVRADRLTMQTGVAAQTVEDILCVFRRCCLLDDLTFRTNGEIVFLLNFRALEDLAWSEGAGGMNIPPQTILVEAEFPSGPEWVIAPRGLLHQAEPERPAR